MSVLIVLFGLLAALAGGAVALFTLGEVPATAVVVAALAVAGFGLVRSGTAVARGAAAVLAIAFLGAIGFGGYQGYAVYAAFTETDGPVDEPDAVALASAEQKLDEAASQAGFRIDLSDRELTAVLQDALAEEADHPIRSVSLQVVDGSDGEDGRIDFEARFKNGSLSASGSVAAELEAGALRIKVLDIGLGGLSVPGVARGALEDIVETVTDLNSRLQEQRADVQAIEIGGGSILIVGVQAGGDLVTLGDVLAGVQENVTRLGGALAAPEERLGPGEVNGVARDGSSYYVALGDSLAANVGVPEARLGYVSRLHRYLQQRDGREYGLRNFGVSGETSGTLIRTGQLQQALDFVEGREVAYVTVDIGANDLLGHIYSADCESSLQTPACQDRLESTLVTYERNLDHLLSRLASAAPQATLIVLGTYNPFSIGFGQDVSLEGESDEATSRLNAVAERVATARGAIYADGFTPMRGTTGATTHMLQQPPDIHPNGAGYDVLAASVAAVLP